MLATPKVFRRYRNTRMPGTCLDQGPLARPPRGIGPRRASISLVMVPQCQISGHKGYIVSQRINTAGVQNCSVIAKYTLYTCMSPSASKPLSGTALRLSCLLGQCALLLVGHNGRMLLPPALLCSALLGVGAGSSLCPLAKVAPVGLLKRRGW